MKEKERNKEKGKDEGRRTGRYAIFILYFISATLAVGGEAIGRKQVSDLFLPAARLILL